MDVFKLTKEQYTPFFEYHGCSIKKTGVEIEIEQPYEGYETGSKTILLLNYTFETYSYIYDIEYSYVENHTNPVYDVDTVYVPLYIILQQLAKKNYVTIDHNSNLTTISFTEYGLNNYIRLFTIIKIKLDELNISYELKPVREINIEDYNQYTCIISEKDICKYTNNKELLLDVVNLLNRVNYEVKFEQGMYHIKIPYYKKVGGKEHIITDLLYSYYLKPWKTSLK